MGTGPIPAKAAIIGDGPGRQEDEAGLPFVGPSGELLDKALAAVGLDRRDIFVTHVTRCSTPHTKSSKGILIKKALKLCRVYLDKELELVKPEVILLMGAAALQSFTGKQDITKRRGSEFFDEKLNAWIVVTVHPAYVLRDPGQAAAFKADIARFARRLRGEGGRQQPTVTLCDTAEKVDQAFTALADAERVAFDLETKGFHDWLEDARIWTIGLAASSDHAWVIPLDHPEAPWGAEHVVHRTIKLARNGAKLKRDVHEFNTPKDPAYHSALYARLAEFLQSKKLIGHHLLFDLKWLRRFGIEAEPHFDTLLAAHLLDENRPLGLENLSHTLLDAMAWGKGTDICFDPPDTLERLGPYNGIDTANTWALFELFSAQLMQNQRLARLFKQAIMPALSAYVRGAHHGIWVDPEKLTAEEKALDDERLELESQLRVYAPEGLNFNATVNVGRWLFGPVDNGGLGLIPFKLTPNKTAPSVDQESLEQLIEAHPVVELLIERNKRVTLLKFFKKWRTLVDAAGRLHPSFNLAGTSTGRRSCSNPSIQNVPRGSRTRSVLGAPPGWKVASFDYCLVPETRALTADLTWKRLDELAVGDELIGFDEDREAVQIRGHGQGKGGHRSFRAAAVTSLKKVTLPTYRVETDKGAVECSADHRWLVTRSGKPQQWKATHELTERDRICYFVGPWGEPDPFEKGYLAGFFDGEGWLSETTIGYGQKEGVVIRYVNSLLRTYGFDIGSYCDLSQMHKNWLRGCGAAIRFLGMFRPERLFPRQRQVWEGRSVSASRRGGLAQIYRVIPVGTRELIAVGTSTKTLIAEGFLSHNSMVELRIVAHLTQDPTMLKALNEGQDLHRITAARITGKPLAEVTKEERQAGKVCNFGFLYGMGAEGFVKYARRSYKQEFNLEEATNIRNAFFDLYNYLPLWHKRQKQIVAGVTDYYGRLIRKPDLQVESPLGRIRRLPHVQSADREVRGLALRQSLNSPIQATPGDLLLIALTTLAPLFDETCYFLGDVHDSALFEIRDDRLAHWVPLIKDAMENLPLREQFGVTISVPLITEFEVGSGWGDQEFSSDTHCPRLHPLEVCLCQRN